MNNKSWRVKTYQEGKYKISVRHNLENDRVDEGDCPEKGHIDQTSTEMKNKGE